MTKKKYLVTGGTGFIGSALVRRLIKEGHAVRILDNHLRGVPERLRDVFDRVEIIEADIRESAAVERACRGVESVCHLAYLNGTKFFYEKPELVLDIGVKGMVNIMDGCVKNGVLEFILASSSEVYQTPPIIPTDETAPLCIPDPMNPRYSYGGGKMISELMAIHYGRKYFNRVLIFRPHNVYGPDMSWEHVIPEFVLRMKELCGDHLESMIKFPIQGSGHETRAFIYIDDFIDGLMTVLSEGKHLETYHIGTMEEVTIQQLACEMGRLFNKDIEIISGKKMEGSPSRRCPDITKLRRLGFSPKISLREGLRKTMRWYIENPHRSLSGLL